MPRVATSHEIDSQVAARGGIVPVDNPLLVKRHVLIDDGDGGFLKIAPVVMTTGFDEILVADKLVPLSRVPHIPILNQGVLVSAGASFVECLLVYAFVRGCRLNESGAELDLRICRAHSTPELVAPYRDVRVLVEWGGSSWPRDSLVQCAVTLGGGLLSVKSLKNWGTLNPWSACL